MTWRQLPFAPAAGTPLCRLDEIADGNALEVSFGGGNEPFRILLLRRGDAVWAYVNRCPHFSLPLNYEPQQFVTLDGEVIMCAHHAAFFRFEDGACFDGPCMGASLEPIPLQRVADSLQVGNGEVD